MMPGWLSSALQALGLTTPAIYAFAAVQTFRWIDARASNDAKTALSDWLRSKNFDSAAVGTATIEMFDLVYTPRLLSWRAFARSALISLCLAAIFLYEAYSGDALTETYALLHAADLQAFQDEVISFGDSIFSNILSDYVSLFAVRHLLVSLRTRPLTALWMGPVVGVGIVAVCNFLLAGVLEDLFLHWRGIVPSSIGFGQTLYGISVLTFTEPEWISLLIAAFVVHLWLPMFALAAGAVSALGWMQWFLRDGQERPYAAIGYLVAAMVLVIALLIKAF